MTHSSVRSATADTGKTVLALVAILSLVLSLFAFNVQPTFADGEGSPTECLDTTEGITGSVGTGDDDERFFTAASGEIVTGVCIKAGPGHSDLITTDGIHENGCYEVEGIGTQTVTVTRIIPGPTCSGISHLDVRTEVANPDLEITKSADATSVAAGDQITYTITVDNSGNAAAANVEITDDLDDSLVVDSATFAVDGGADTDCTVGAGNSISCLVGSLDAGSQAVATIVVTTSAESCDEVRNVSSVSADNDEGDTSDEVVVGVVCQEDGGLSITKVGDCEDCDTFTRGKYFNRGQGSFNTDSLFDAGSGGAISIPGTGYSFTSEADVQAYIDSDVDDPLTEQTVVQYVTTVLNVRYNLENNDGCDLGNQIYSGSVDAFTAEPTTVNEIIEAAAATLAGNQTYSLEDVKDALDEINNSGGDGEGEEDVLECAGGETGGGLAGVTFELFLDDGDGEFDDGDTEITEGGPFVTGENGELTITGLEAGDYFLVEVDRPAECGALEAPIVFGPFTVEAGVTTVVSDPLVNDCDDDGEEEEFDFSLVKEDQDGNPMEAIEFNLTDGDDYDQTVSTSAEGTVTFTGLTEGEYTLTENDTTCTNDGPWTVSVAADGTITVTDATVTDLEPNTDGSFTIVNTCEEDEDNGLLEVDKFWCSTEDETSTEFIVGEPTPMDAVTAQSHEEGEGCPLGGHEAEFEIQQVGGTMTWTLPVGLSGIAELELPDGEYTITETSSDEDPEPSATFTIMAGHVTVVIVINNEGEEQEEGELKVIKLLCEGDEASVSFVIEDGDQTAPDLENCEFSEATVSLNGGDAFVVDGTWFEAVPAGSYVLTETEPNDGASPSFDVEVGEITTVIIINTFDEGEQGGEGPGQNETPREGTQGGNPLPNTATSPIPTGSVPAALLALLMLAGLGAAGHAVRAEAQRRR